MVLISGDLRGVVNAFEVSRRTMSNIHQNLAWAFGYNVILIPVAAGVLYPFEWAPEMLRQLHPVLAAFAMAIRILVDGLFPLVEDWQATERRRQEAEAAAPAPIASITCP